MDHVAIGQPGASYADLHGEREVVQTFSGPVIVIVRHGRDQPDKPAAKPRRLADILRTIATWFIVAKHRRA